MQVLNIYLMTWVGIGNDNLELIPFLKSFPPGLRKQFRWFFSELVFLLILKGNKFQLEIRIRYSGIIFQTPGLRLQGCSNIISTIAIDAPMIMKYSLSFVKKEISYVKRHCITETTLALYWAEGFNFSSISSWTWVRRPCIVARPIRFDWLMRTCALGKWHISLLKAHLKLDCFFCVRMTQKQPSIFSFLFFFSLQV